MCTPHFRCAHPTSSPVRSPHGLQPGPQDSAGRPAGPQSFCSIQGADARQIIGSLQGEHSRLFGGEPCGTGEGHRNELEERTGLHPPTFLRASQSPALFILPATLMEVCHSCFKHAELRVQRSDQAFTKPGSNTAGQWTSRPFLLSTAPK